LSTKNAKSVDKLAKTATCPPKTPNPWTNPVKRQLVHQKTGISVDEIPDQVGDDEKETCIIE
jgi:hypothetical protein